MLWNGRNRIPRRQLLAVIVVASIIITCNITQIIIMLGLSEKPTVDRFFPEDVGAIVSAVDAKSGAKSCASFCSSSTTKTDSNLYQ